jgi:ribonucleoside-diphosphate reductase alpha chain
MATKISEVMRDAPTSHRSSWPRSAAAFPLFNADMYLSGGNFASRLPQKSRTPSASTACATRTCCRSRPPAPSPGLRRQRLNGIEPPFSWTYTRKKRMADGTFKEYAVEDYAWRMYKHLGGDVTKLPDYFVTALEISAQAHKDMVAAVAPYVDTSISKTVNVPADYPYADFEDLYLAAWKAGLKGLATYRPNSRAGQRAVGRRPPHRRPRRSSRTTSKSTGANRACPSAPCPPRCCPACAGPAGRDMADGNTAWTYMLEDAARRIRALRRPDRKRHGPQPCPSKCG